MVVADHPHHEVGTGVVALHDHPAPVGEADTLERGARASVLAQWSVRGRRVERGPVDQRRHEAMVLLIDRVRILLRDRRYLSRVRQLTDVSSMTKLVCRLESSVPVNRTVTVRPA